MKLPKAIRGRVLVGRAITPSMAPHPILSRWGCAETGPIFQFRVHICLALNGCGTESTTGLRFFKHPVRSP